MTQLFDVFGLDASDVYVRTFALALPVAVLLTLIVLLGMKARKKRNKARVLAEQAAANSVPAPQALGRHDPAPVATAPVATVAAAPLPAALAQRSAAMPVVVTAPVVVKPAEPVIAVPVPPPPVAAPVAPSVAAEASAPHSIESAKSVLNEKLSSAPKTSLAPLYLELARLCRSAGDEAGCLAALRSAAGIGAQHGPRAAHAEARIELAEAAYSSGDLHGACEQWQMARMALHEDGQKEAYARVDKRMLQHGCPTDWVLTDF